VTVGGGERDPEHRERLEQARLRQRAGVDRVEAQDIGERQDRLLGRRRRRRR